MRLQDGRDFLTPIKVIFPPVVFALSIIAMSGYGSLVLFLWVTVSLSFAIVLFTEWGSEMLDRMLLTDENDEKEDLESNSESQIREFVYLNSLSVKSLLASLNIAITEETRKVSQEIEKVSLRTGMETNAGSTETGSISANASLLNTETGNEILETRNRINDQYLFNQLKRELEERDAISKLPDNWDNSSDGYNLDLDEIDLIKIKGTAKTDPLFRMINVVSLFSKIDSFDLDPKTVEDAKENIYGGQLGLELSNDDDVTYVMSLEEKNLWTDDPRREFSGSRDYSVIGRVIGVIGENEEWDYVELLRVSDTVLDADSMGSIRGTIDDFVNMIDSFDIDIPLPDLENADMDDLQSGDKPPTTNSNLQFNVKDKRISVEGPAIIVEPVAIYW